MAGHSRIWRGLGAVFCAVTLLLADFAPVLAQERRTLFDMLFRNERRQPRANPSIIQMQQPRPRVRQPRSVTRTPAPAQPRAEVAAEPAVEKREDARKILVVGDFTAASLGTGLEASFADDPSVVVVNEGSGSSGLVRQDFFNWPVELQNQIETLKPALVVVMIGANDRQSMVIGEQRERFKTEAWLKEYERRVAELAGIVSTRSLPLLWVGLPAFQSTALTADAVTMNGIYRQNVEKLGGQFVDVWDGFVSEEGQFIITGSDINGQQVRLRSADGIGFTEAGKRKLAFYVEKLARRQLGDVTLESLTRLDSGDLPLLGSLPPEAEASVPTQPISLSDPQLDGGDVLLGSSAPTPNRAMSPRTLLLTKGEVPDAPVGRVDNYRLTPQPEPGAAQ